MSISLRVPTRVSSKNSIDQTADSIAFLVPQGFSCAREYDAIATTFFPLLSQAMAQQGFTGKPLTSFVVSGNNKGKVVDLIFVGLGEAKEGKKIEIEMLRRALGCVARIVESRKVNSLALQLPQATLFGLDEQSLAKQTVIALQMAFYHFDEFITEQDRKINNLKELYIMTDGDTQHVEQGVQEGIIIAESVNLSRYWIDLPPDHATPDRLVDHAQKIADQHGLKCTVFNEKQIIAMGMGGLAAVSKGSDRDCHLVIMEYHADSNAPTLGFVGKGITFDSGGLSIKPAASMETMKEDMSGAAAVIAAMQAVAQLKPKVNIVAITPLAENLPSGKATKPGDIATFYNGKTAEIKNTDAEGRLILADALSYVVKHYKIDGLIDLATLTGACAYALGPYFSGLMSQHDDFTAQVCKAAETSGDRVWRLPLPDDYKMAIRSNVADISNIGSPRYMAGAITAGLFLQNFVGTVPWVHLDIAGTAFNVPDISYYRGEGATGVGVRLLVELAMNWRKH